MDELLIPGPSTFDLVMLRTFLIVVEATALPVNTVPPIFEPVPSVEVATASTNGSVAPDSVVVALASITGRGSSGPGIPGPFVMFSKFVLSVSDSSFGTSAELDEEVEEPSALESVAVSGVVVAGSSEVFPEASLDDVVVAVSSGWGGEGVESGVVVAVESFSVGVVVLTFKFDPSEFEGVELAVPVAISG